MNPLPLRWALTLAAGLGLLGGATVKHCSHRALNIQPDLSESYNSGGRSSSLLDPRLQPDPVNGANGRRDAIRSNVFVDSTSRLVVPTNVFSSYFTHLPLRFLNEEGSISDEAIEFLNLNDQEFEELNEVVKKTAAAVTLLEVSNTAYHSKADGSVDWVHIRPFDVSQLKGRFANDLKRLMGQRVAAMVLSDPSVMNPLFRVSANADRVYRFEYEGDAIRVTTGFGKDANDVDQILFDDLPEKLPWWFKHLVVVQNIPAE